MHTPTPEDFITAMAVQTRLEADATRELTRVLGPEVMLQSSFRYPVGASLVRRLAEAWAFRMAVHDDDSDGRRRARNKAKAARRAQRVR